MGIKRDFKSMVQGYFDMSNGKIVTTEKLEQKLLEWELTHDELKSIIEVAKSHNKNRPWMVDAVMTYAIEKQVKKVINEGSKEERIALYIIGLVLLLSVAIDNLEFDSTKKITTDNFEL